MAVSISADKPSSGQTLGSGEADTHTHAHIYLDDMFGFRQAEPDS